MCHFCSAFSVHCSAVRVARRRKGSLPRRREGTRDPFAFLSRDTPTAPFYIINHFLRPSLPPSLPSSVNSLHPSPACAYTLSVIICSLRAPARQRKPEAEIESERAVAQPSPPPLPAPSPTPQLPLLEPLLPTPPPHLYQNNDHFRSLCFPRPTAFSRSIPSLSTPPSPRPPTSVSGLLAVATSVVRKKTHQPRANPDPSEAR